MKLSYEWLKEYVGVKAPPEEVAHGLTMSGSEVEAIQTVGQDKVMDLEITSNRPDCLSIVGLAREVSTVFDKELHLPELKVPAGAGKGKGPQVECVIKSPRLCPRYTARVITDVNVAESSTYIKKRVTAVGLRLVNNIVDITNYCLMELGQPLHAFDLDKIKGNKIIVREAVKGEKIVTIDGVERELEPGMLVIADSERPVAIAGVMGGLDTEVGEKTKNVLLESAYFEHASVRQTARKLGLSSESSYRFERGVDRGMVAGASDRASVLIAKEANGKICGFYGVGEKPDSAKGVKFDVEKAGNVLGIDLKQDKVKHIFERLGLKIEKEKGHKILVQPSTFREDLKREIDLVEEVARIYGYDNIPATMTKLLFQVKRKGRSRLAEEKLREVLPALGLNEVITYSLISEQAVERFSDMKRGKLVQLSNPLSEDHKIMVSQLLDGMLKTVSWNINRKNKDLKLFEIGRIYSRIGGEFRERPTLCIGLTGFAKKDWKEGEREIDFYDLKGIVEAFFSGLKLEPVFTFGGRAAFTSCAEISLQGDSEKIGFLGEVSNKILKEYDIKQKVFICQIELESIYEKTVLEEHYSAVTRFPSSSRDVSILCDKQLSAGEVFETIKQSEKELIRDIRLVDVYEGDQIPAKKKSLTFSIEYGLDDRTLKEEEVEASHSKVKDSLTKKLGVTFR
ncbi:MAG: phenylalanine--tRNA ligase subunit beta [Candidatus Omnitrophota bacterium]